jgi:hypothetical protein
MHSHAGRTTGALVQPPTDLLSLVAHVEQQLAQSVPSAMYAADACVSAWCQCAYCVLLLCCCCRCLCMIHLNGATITLRHRPAPPTLTAAHLGRIGLYHHMQQGPQALPPPATGPGWQHLQVKCGRPTGWGRNAGSSKCAPTAGGSFIAAWWQTSQQRPC